MKEITRIRMELNDEMRIRAFRKGPLIQKYRSYKKLRIAVAQLAHYNPSLRLYFRGQQLDSRDQAGRMSLMPSIFRDQPSEDRLGGKISQRLTSSILNNRSYDLDLAESLFLGRLRYKDWEHGFQRVRHHTEVAWAILQHYEVTRTPLLDVTPSLDVALNFAFAGCGKTGALYVIGIPANMSPMHFDYLNNLVFLSLASLIPPIALRPHFQSACLVGPWPLTFDKASQQYDVARRLVAAFWLDRREMKRTGYRDVEPELLFPKNDAFERLCKHVRSDLQNASGDPELTPHSGLFTLFLKADSSWRGGERYVELIVAGESRQEAHRRAIVFLKKHHIQAHCSIQSVKYLNRSSQWHMSRAHDKKTKSLIREARKNGVAGSLRSFHPNGGHRYEIIGKNCEQSNALDE